MILGLVGLFAAFVIYRRVRIGIYMREYEARAKIEKEKKDKIDLHVREVEKTATTRAAEAKEALDGCVAREGEAVQAAIAIAMKAGVAKMGNRPPKAADKERLAGAYPYGFPTDESPGGLPYKASVGLATPWLGTQITNCRIDGYAYLTSLDSLVKAPPDSYGDDYDKRASDWEKQIDVYLAKLPKNKELKSAPPPASVLLVREDCTETVVDSFVETSGISVGSSMKVFSYACKAFVAWVGVPDGAVLGTLGATGYAAPKKYLPDNVTTTEITNLNSETYDDAVDKAHAAMQKTLVSWGGARKDAP